MGLETGRVLFGELHRVTAVEGSGVVEGSIAGKRVHVHSSDPVYITKNASRTSVINLCQRRDCTYKYKYLGGKGWKKIYEEKKLPDILTKPKGKLPE